MIVKNEAANLARCLSSVCDLVDQLVVLDTGSTDETVAIAESFQAEVHHFAWNNDFSGARNQALQYVKGDWVLVLDADEVLDAEVGPTLKLAMQNEKALVINLVRQEIGAVQSPYSLVSRLFRRHPQIYFSRPYHALIDDSVAALLQSEPDWRIVTCPDVAILHYGYEPGTIASRNKLEQARAAMSGFLAEHPDDPYVCSKLGALYVEMQEFEQGVKLLQRGVISDQADAPVRYELHYHLGIAYSRLQRFVEAEHHYRVAASQPILDCLKLGAYNNLANLLKAKGDSAGAQSAYQTCLGIDPNFAIGHCNLGLTLKAMGQPEAAIAHYQRAIQLDPNYADAYQNLGVVLLKLGRVAESLDAFQQAVSLHELRNPTEAARLRQGLAELGWRI
jgi:tetratricopeptide (TPR) repeat protein